MDSIGSEQQGLHKVTSVKHLNSTKTIEKEIDTNLKSDTIYKNTLFLQEFRHQNEKDPLEGSGDMELRRNDKSKLYTQPRTSTGKYNKFYTWKLFQQKLGQGSMRSGRVTWGDQL